jgi:acyl dehydratase
MVSQDQAGGNMPTEIIFDEIKIGETFGPVELLADEKMVREYCDERGDHNPIYLENSPFGGRVVPPALKASLMGQRTLATKYDMHATVPTKSEHEYLHPARVGKRLITTGKVTGKYIKRGLEYLIVESLTVDEDGIEIRRSKEHILLGLKRRHGNLTQGSEDSVGGSLFSRTAGPEAGRTVVSLNDFPVGSEIPSLTKVAYQSTLHTQVFLADSIHDAEYAKSHDYAGPLVSGYVLNEYMSEALVNFFGPGWLQGGMISLTFIRPGVQEGDKVTCRGTIAETVMEKGAVRLSLDIWIEKEPGIKVATGRASGILKSP